MIYVISSISTEIVEDIRKNTFSKNITNTVIDNIKNKKKTSLLIGIHTIKFVMIKMIS